MADKRMQFTEEEKKALLLTQEIAEEINRISSGDVIWCDVGYLRDANEQLEKVALHLKSNE